jgi:hypothetical protein
MGHGKGREAMRCGLEEEKRNEKEQTAVPRAFHLPLVPPLCAWLSYLFAQEEEGSSAAAAAQFVISTFGTEQRS